MVLSSSRASLDCAQLKRLCQCQRPDFVADWPFAARLPGHGAISGTDSSSVLSCAEMPRSVVFLMASPLLLAACSANDSARTPPPAASAGSSGAAGTSSGGSSAGSGGGQSLAGAGAGDSGGSSGTAGETGSAGSAGAGGGGAGQSALPLFHDDFEAASVDMTRWTERINGAGSFAIDSAQKHGGASALHVTSSGFSVLLAAEGAPIFPAPDNTFYGRVWLYVPGPLPESAHVVWIEAGDVDNDQHEVRIGMNLGALQVNLYQNGEVDLRAPGAPLLAETWHCVEFKMGNDELELWLDGARIDDLSTTDWVASDSANGNTQAKSGWSPTYAALRIGWELSGAEIFYDDVALDHVRIGCE